MLSAMLLGLSAAPMIVSAEASEPEAIYEMGDVNHDGVINPVDACLVLRYYTLSVSGNPITGELPDEINNSYFDHIATNADINGDGQINSYDATGILKIYTKNSGVSDKNTM